MGQIELNYKVLPHRDRVDVGNEKVLRIPQSSSITETSPSNCLVSYPGALVVGGVLLLCREAASIFYSLSRQGNSDLEW